ncbi:hypothetical protein LDENG_00253270 [Lucifuga dentata]|nr:hypothetical protein LDENG_00253270 [Lucifuga dentata]
MRLIKSIKVIVQILDRLFWSESGTKLLVWFSFTKTSNQTKIYQLKSYLQIVCSGLNQELNCWFGSVSQKHPIKPKSIS